MRTRLFQLLPVLLAATAIAAPGCGDDDPSSETTPAAQPATAPKTSTQPTETTPKASPDTTAPSTPDSQDQSGGSGGTSGPGGGVDSPENDIPPPKGSPAERFEQECQVNPDVCR